MYARGTVLIVSSGSGLSRKPRPMIVVQATGIDFPETLLVVPLSSGETSENAFTPVLVPDEQNGLQFKSRAMINRVGPIRKSEIGQIIGSLSERDIERIDSGLMTVFGLGMD